MTEELIERLWNLHRRGMSYASDKPAVNLLLADLSEGIRDAANRIADDQSLSARVAELEGVLKPFAVYADIQDSHRRADDEGFCSTTVHGSTGKTTRLTCGDLRIAAKASPRPLPVYRSTRRWKAAVVLRNGQ